MPSAGNQLSVRQGGDAQADNCPGAGQDKREGNMKPGGDHLGQRDNRKETDHQADKKGHVHGGALSGRDRWCRLVERARWKGPVKATSGMWLSGESDKLCPGNPDTLARGTPRFFVRGILTLCPGNPSSLVRGIQAPLSGEDGCGCP